MPALWNRAPKASCFAAGVESRPGQQDRLLFLVACLIRTEDAHLGTLGDQVETARRRSLLQNQLRELTDALETFTTDPLRSAR